MGEEHQRQMLTARVRVGVGGVGADGGHGLRTVLLLLFPLRLPQRRRPSTPSPTSSVMVLK
jgi:hypothetical protein